MKRTDKGRRIRPTMIYAFLWLMWLLPTALRAEDTIAWRFGPDAPSDMQRCRIIDANADGYSWRYTPTGPAVIYEGNDNDADDYLFLPPVELTDTGCYRIFFQAIRDAEPQVLTLGVSTAQSAATFSVLRVFTSELTATNYSTLGATFHCQKPGVYYPTLHITSKAGSMSLRCKNIRVEKSVGQVRTPPFELLPTQAEASEFTILDADGDGVSWLYNSDSASLCVSGSLGKTSDDWLLLPPFRGKPGSYALEMDVQAASAGIPEIYEVRYGPDGVDPEMWQTVLTNPSVTDSPWRERALMELRDSVTYRAAVRYRSAGGDGLHLRRFSVSESKDSLLSLPCTITVDTTLRPGDMIMLNPFRTPQYLNAGLVIKYRGTGPRPPEVALMHAPVAEERQMQPIGTVFDMLNRNSAEWAMRFYGGNYAGQTVLGIRVGSADRDPVVIESITIDTLRNPTAPELPCLIEPDTLISDSALLGPVWIDNRIPAQIDVTATGHYQLLWGIADSTERMTELKPNGEEMPDTVLRYYALPQGFGAHYMAIVPLDDTVRVNRIEITRSNLSTNNPGVPALSAEPIPNPNSKAQVTVILPRHNFAGMELWENENLTVSVTSGCDTVVAYGLPGDTMSLCLRVPQGMTSIAANCAGWFGWGPKGYTQVYGGEDAPIRITGLEALPDADNTGVLLRWNLDSIGAHGAYVNPSTISYRIEHSIEGTDRQRVDTVRGIASALIQRVVTSGNQRPIRWRVIPFNDYGQGDTAMTVSLTGPALTLPLTETFHPQACPVLPIALTDSLTFDFDADITDPSRIPNHVMRLQGRGSLLLPSFKPKPHTRLLMRVLTRADATATLELLTEGRTHMLDSALVSVCDSGWHTLCVSIPDTLIKPDKAATFRLHLQSGQLLVSEYDIREMTQQNLLLDWVSLPDTLFTGRENIFRARFTNAGTYPIAMSPTDMRVSTGGRVFGIYPSGDDHFFKLGSGQGKTLTYRFTPAPGTEGEIATMEISPANTDLYLQAMLPIAANPLQTTGIVTASETGLETIMAIPGGIRVIGMAGKRLDICTTDGRQAASLTVPDDDHTLSLPPSLYIIRSKARARKVLVYGKK